LSCYEVVQAQNRSLGSPSGECRKSYGQTCVLVLQRETYPETESVHKVLAGIVRGDDGILTETKDEDCPRHIDVQSKDCHPHQYSPNPRKFASQNCTYRSKPAGLPHSWES